MKVSLSPFLSLQIEGRMLIAPSKTPLRATPLHMCCLILTRKQPTTNPHVKTKSTDFRLEICLDPSVQKANLMSEIGRFGLTVRVGGM